MWKGPEIDGVTQSLLNKFIECPYSFYLYAILGLEEEETDPRLNLIWGDCYHKGLEILIESRDKVKASKEMKQYLYDNYPQAPESFQHSLGYMIRLYRLNQMPGEWETEQVIDEVIDVQGHKVRLRGKKDAITHNHPQYGHVLGEHKCKGYINPDLVQEEINVDVQCNVYLRTEPECEWVAYDLIKIPDVQKYGPAKTIHESVEDYVKRIYTDGSVGSYNGQYPIMANSHKWIHQGMYFFPKEDQEAVWQHTITPNILRLIEWYDYVTSPSFDFENPDCYNTIFYRHPVRHFNGRKTESFKCNYHAYLTNQIELSDLNPVESYYSELEEE